ncbi:MAG: ABC transporter substrate-binding protein [Pseudomonadota bacterium]
MWKKRISVLFTLISGLSFASPKKIEKSTKLRAISISLLEIDPKEVGSKARPERRRVIESALQLAVSDRSKELSDVGLRLTIEMNDLYQAPNSASAGVLKAIAGNSLAGIGLPTSYYAEHGGATLDGSDLTIVSPFATSAMLERFSRNLVLLMPTNRQSALAFGQEVQNDLRAKSVAIVVPWDNAFSKDFYEQLPAPLRDTSTLIKVLDDQQNLDTVSKKVVDLNPDVVVLASFPAFTGKLIRSIYEKGYRGTFAGPSSWGEGEGKPLHALTKDLPIKAVLVREASEYFSTPEQSRFAERFNSVSGMAFSSEAGLYYDAANLVIDRIVQLGSKVSRASLTDAIRKEKKRCGIFSNVCKKGTQSKSIPFYVVTYERGKFSPKKVIYVGH